MRIHDEELGPMRWHVRLDGEKITAEAVVETTRVQDLLRTHQDVLHAKLNAIGVEVEDFDVFVDQGSQRFSPFSERRGAARSGRPAVETLSPVEVLRPGPMAGTTQDRRLDLYV
jgi:flagellar hook-length control protein FliK